ncbi:DUF4178 domain-containing protein [Desulfococcus sp.]|uniref:DUF4178 domain-containing protein n=1 Tax=Desulfococcus sp. TaxID=2025834 RepID=UPI0035936651
MGWKEFFGFGRKRREPDPGGSEEKPSASVTDLTLADLQVGYVLDYDMKTWEVTAQHHYDWGDGGTLSHEWQMKSHDDTLYLEKASDDEVEWCVCRPIPFSRLGARVRNHIQEHEDPPDEIEFEGTTYHLDEFGGGKFFRNGKGPGREFLVWDYEDDAGERFLSIEQWDEDDFEVFVGIFVEEYQFTNILPRIG